MVDYAAALARLEHIVEILRTRHVSDNFRLDAGGAARALNYLRNLGAGKVDDEDPAWQAEWSAMLNFVYDHGQSLDWIFRGNPSALICNAAASAPRPSPKRPFLRIV